MINPDKPKENQSQACVTKLKALADPIRLSVLETLIQGPKHVNELMKIVNVEQSLLSHHLKVLRDVGLVDSLRDGKAVMYRVARGVTGKSSGKTIHLGCCKLSF